MSKETITLETLLSELLGMVHERWGRDNLEGYINERSIISTHSLRHQITL